MTTGILKTGMVLENKIASGINDDISLSQTTKRFRNHYNKLGFFRKFFKRHMESPPRDYILFDGSDIQKKYAKSMDGLDYVKDGDKYYIGFGY